MAQVVPAFKYVSQGKGDLQRFGVPPVALSVEKKAQRTFEQRIEAHYLQRSTSSSETHKAGGQIDCFETGRGFGAGPTN